MFFHYKFVKEKRALRKLLWIVGQGDLCMFLTITNFIWLNWIEILKRKSQNTWFRHIWTGRSLIKYLQIYFLHCASIPLLLNLNEGVVDIDINDGASAAATAFAPLLPWEWRQVFFWQSVQKCIFVKRNSIFASEKLWDSPNLID
jgi:hypothetical protein